MMSFIACRPSAQADIAKKILDSIKKADSLKNVLKLDSLRKDSIAQDKLKRQEDSLANIKNSQEKDNKTTSNCGADYQKISGIITKFEQPGPSGVLYGR